MKDLAGVHTSEWSFIYVPIDPGSHAEVRDIVISDIFAVVDDSAKATTGGVLDKPSEA